MGDRDGVKLFVYGVSSSCPRSLIQREFDKFGRVDDVFITGKGYAFVTMEDIEDAKDAIKELNGATIDGQEVKVEFSHGKGRRPGDRDRGGRGFGRRDRSRSRSPRRDRGRDRSSERDRSGDRRRRDDSRDRRR